MRPRSSIEMAPIRASAASDGRQQIRVTVPTNNGMRELSDDLQSFHTPQHLRDTLQGIDKLERDHKVETRNSIGLGLTAFAGAFAAAPSLLTVIQACPSGTDKSDKQSCIANWAAVVGAAIGIVGLGYSVWGMVLGRTHHKDQIKQMDYELDQRYRLVAEQNQRTSGQGVQQLNNSSRIASRYLALSPVERKQVLEDLFNKYLAERAAELLPR
jgi:hypothetical protein